MTVSEEYKKDESGFTGDAEELFFPLSLEEIAELSAANTEITVQGSKTGISGSCVPMGGSVVNMSRVKADPVIGKNEEGFYVDVLPGTTMEELEKVIDRKESKGWYLPVEPTEKSATIGGAYASNSQGPSPLKRYKVSDHLLEADVYFPEKGWKTIRKGEAVFDNQGVLNLDGWEIRSDYADSSEYKAIDCLTPYAGMDLLELLSGSEGQLGIFGRLRFRLVKQPEKRWKLLCFAQEESLLSLGETILSQMNEWENVTLMALDLLDKNSVSLIKEKRNETDKYDMIPDLPEEECAALLIDLASEDGDATDAVLEELLCMLDELCVPEENVWAADSLAEQAIINIFRHAVPESVNTVIEEARRSDASIRKLAIDVQADLVWADVLAKVRAVDIANAVTIHMGRNVFHIDYLVKEASQMDAAVEAKRALVRYFAENRALFAAENGFGKGKYERADLLISEKQIEIIEHIKRSFDPLQKLNKGNLWI